jgi:hypothetical protein
MSDPKHPTNPTWELYDPEVLPAPRGKDLLLINEGGVLIRGTWYDGALAWGFAPRIPQSVKDRLNKQPTWTGSRDDVTALLKEKGLL